MNPQSHLDHELKRIAKYADTSQSAAATGFGWRWIGTVINRDIRGLEKELIRERIHGPIRSGRTY